ncbi:MAG: enoyl-CoA hydratase/isomerase family protein [Chloroflexi bacterium]|nr:enoyl-CoA hydratase/isomerase family protein [Chloroflexota bacterium]
MDTRKPETIKYEIRENVAYVTLNRPDKLNAIDTQMKNELFEAFIDVKENPEVWIAVITGAGRAFSVGHDLVEMATNVSGGRSTDDLYVYQSTIFKPIIASINGFCLAQGAGIALCSDIRIASDQVKLGWPQVKRGISSISGPTLLAHGVPFNVAMQALMTGELFDAPEAHRVGLVNLVVPHDQLEARTQDMVDRIRVNAPVAMRAIKEVAVRGLDLNLEQRVRLARFAADVVKQSADAKEGLLAFREKRQPVWQGR